MQREDDGDYEDHEGENMYAEVEDPYISDKQYKCDNCKKKKTEKQNNLFAPFCCNRPMKLINHLEHKFDFESLAKRYINKEQERFPTSKKRVKKGNSKKTKKQNKPKTAKKSTKNKKSTKKKRK